MTNIYKLGCNWRETIIIFVIENLFELVLVGAAANAGTRTGGGTTSRKQSQIGSAREPGDHAGMVVVMVMMVVMVVFVIINC